MLLSSIKKIGQWLPLKPCRWGIIKGESGFSPLIASKIRRFRRELLKIGCYLLPAVCVLCHTKTVHHALCTLCLQELPWQAQACPRCGQSLSNTQLCGECLTNPPPYHNTICLFHYQTPIDYFILAIKFAENLIYAQLLGKLMAEKIYDFYNHRKKPDCIIPVPLHNIRLKERGFNQALEIARPIAKKLDIPINTRHCQRILHTAPQTSISAAARKHNIKHAFAVNSSLQAKHVAIVDDVLTTGSTVAELSQQLKKSGVQHIDIWCCARTTRPIAT